MQHEPEGLFGVCLLRMSSDLSISFRLASRDQGKINLLARRGVDEPRLGVITASLYVVSESSSFSLSNLINDFSFSFGSSSPASEASIMSSSSGSACSDDEISSSAKLLPCSFFARFRLALSKLCPSSDRISTSGVSGRFRPLPFDRLGGFASIADDIPAQLPSAVSAEDLEICDESSPHLDVVAAHWVLVKMGNEVQQNAMIEWIQYRKVRTQDFHLLCVPAEIAGQKIAHPAGSMQQPGVLVFAQM
jgi:hypothetical protein